MSDLDKYGNRNPLDSCYVCFFLSLSNEKIWRCRAITLLRACRPIPEPQVRELCYKARELLIEEGNVVAVDAPVTVMQSHKHSFPNFSGKGGVVSNSLPRQ